MEGDSGVVCEAAVIIFSRRGTKCKAKTVDTVGDPAEIRTTAS
jgi:hypothetical protein